MQKSRDNTLVRRFHLGIWRHTQREDWANTAMVWSTLRNSHRYNDALSPDIHTYIHTYIHTDICIYIYISIRGAFNKFPDFFVQAFKFVINSSVCYCYTSCEMTDQFYDFRFKWRATAAIGIHPTKTWLSQLVNFQNAIWTWGHFRRTICNKIALNLEKMLSQKCMECFRLLLEHLA